MGEKIIRLDEIDHTKERPDEALGIPEEEIKNCVKEIGTEHKTYGGILRELGLSESEVRQALSQASSADKKAKISKAIVLLWEKKDRKTITLREFVGTAMVMQGILYEEKKELASVKKKLRAQKKAILLKTIPKILQRFD